MMFEKLRSLNLDRIDVDEAIELVTFGRQASSTYAAYNVPTPEWLKDGVFQLDAEIKRRRKDILEARAKEIAKEIKATLSTLKTREEKRDELLAEMAKVNDALGTPSAA